MADDLGPDLGNEPLSNGEDTTPQVGPIPRYY